MVLKGLCSLKEKYESVKEFYEFNSSVKKTALEFCNEEIQPVDPLYSLFIGQGEYGIVPGMDTTIKVIGSDDATTCHNLIILNRFTNTVAVCHMDNRKEEDTSLTDIISEIKLIDKDYDLEVYVVGGYSENITCNESDTNHTQQNSSHDISLKLLNFLMNHEQSFVINLWCTCHVNTVEKNGIAFPRFLGLAYDRTSMTVFPAFFPTRNPCMTLRSASEYVISNTKLVKIYDHQNKLVVVKPFVSKNCLQYKRLSKLPDIILRNNFSTSPLVEPKGFASRIRESFELLGQDVPLFKDNQPRKFKLDSDGVWRELTV